MARRSLSALLILALLGMCAACAPATTENEETYYGQITALDEQTLTLALGTMPDDGAPSELPEGTSPGGELPEGTPPGGELPEGAPPSGELPEGTPPGGELPEGTPPGGELPEGAPPSGELPEGTPPSGEIPGNPPDGGFFGGIQLTGEELSFTINEQTTFEKEGTAASLSDFAVGDVVRVVAKEGTALTVTLQNLEGGRSFASQSGETETRGLVEVTDTQTKSGESLESNEADVSAAVVKDGGDLTLTEVEVIKTGDTSNTESSEFYGLNAALLAKAGSRLDIRDSTVSTQAEGANAIFATGEDAEIYVSDVTIRTTENSSRGLDSTYGGSITAENVDIMTQGAHSAALATDRGEGTVTVTNSTLSTAGEGSPCVYSTGNITVSDSTGVATGAGLAVVEGKNSITLENCTFHGAGKGRANGGIDDAGVMIYQSMSGDAGEGTGTFTATDSSLSIDADSEKYDTAPFFFVTNTDAEIYLTNTQLAFGSGVLLSASGNDGEWGTAGQNGGRVTLEATNQTLEGDIVADSLSTLSLRLMNSAWSGALNEENTAKTVELSLDADSTWTLTGDSYVHALSNEDTSCSNIFSSGYTLYYDAQNSANDWLEGRTLQLEGGGQLTPMPVAE